MGSLFSFWQRMVFVDTLKRNGMICRYLKVPNKTYTTNWMSQILKIQR